MTKHTSNTWQTMTLGKLEANRLVTLRNGFPCGNNNESGRGIPHIRPMNITVDSRISLGSVKYIETDRDISTYRILPNDVIFNNTNSHDLVGKTALWDCSLNDAVPSNHMSIIRFADNASVEPYYIAQYLHLLWLQRYFERIRRQHVNQASISLERLREVTIPLPPLPEQRAIAKALRAVQEAKDARKKEIALERERKAALMEFLFTHGTKGEPRKQTDIGEIPQSWNVVKLGKMCKIVRGASPRPKSDPRYYRGTIPRLMIADITRDGIFVTPRIDHLTEEGAALSRPMKKGDLILSISGTVALPCFLAVDACIHDGFIGLKDIDPKIDAFYLLHQLFFWRDRLNLIAPMGSIFKNLTTDIVKNFPIYLPTIQEQLFIANTLTSCDKKMAVIRTEINLLDELFRGMLEELMSGRLSAVPLIGKETRA